MASGKASRRKRAQRAQRHPIPAPKPGRGRAPWVLAAAPVTLVEFVDLQCPYCREFAVDAFPALVEKYVRTGKVRIELRGLAFLGPDSERGLRAGFAAGRQGRMFDLMELL